MVEEIEFPSEWTFWSSGSFSNGFDEAMRLGDPGDDEAGFCQLGKSDDGCVVLVHESNTHIGIFRACILVKFVKHLARYGSN